jgi:glycosyltransferase involved in cell wall biosynthesis
VFACLPGTGKKEVLFADGTGADFFSDEVVVNFDAAVVQIGLHAAKGVVGITEGFAKAAFGEVPAVPPGDIREMVSALRRLIINTRLRREFGAFNRERFQENYPLLAYQQR